MKLAIIAGGKGTRLGLMDIPKPMVKVGGKPVLEHQIELARRYGIKDVYILSGHLSDEIIEYFGNGSEFDMRIIHLVEDIPLGTAGAVKMLEGKVENRFMVFYGDTLMDIDLNSFRRFDAIFDSIGTIIVHPNNHPFDSDLVEMDEENTIIAFHSKPHDESKYFRNLVNAALYILSPKVFDYIEPNKSSDFGRDIFPRLLMAGETIKGYNTPEYIKDMGTPDRLSQAEMDLQNGKIARLNKSNKRNAVFVDRDGVINQDIDNLCKLEDFELLGGVAKALKRINSSEYLSIVVTNQPVVAKGFCTAKELDEIHKKMETLLGREGAFIDGLYYCPHHPEKGFEREVEKLKVECECRKPNPGMIIQAAKDFNVALEKSFFIGDRLTDIIAGKNAGVKTILVNNDCKNTYDPRADFVVDSLSGAVDIIMGKRR